MENQGRKNDQEKPRMDLISPEALLQLAKVLTVGASKYSENNWRLGMNWTRLIAAALRHINAFNNGEDLDPETGLPHPAHAMACMSFLLEYMADEKGVDDRYKRAVVSKHEQSNYDSCSSFWVAPGTPISTSIFMPSGVIPTSDCCEP